MCRRTCCWHGWCSGAAGAHTPAAGMGGVLVLLGPTHLLLNLVVFWGLRFLRMRSLSAGSCVVSLLRKLDMKNCSRGAGGRAARCQRVRGSWERVAAVAGCGPRCKTRRRLLWGIHSRLSCATGTLKCCPLLCSPPLPLSGHRRSHLLLLSDPQELRLVHPPGQAALRVPGVLRLLQAARGQPRQSTPAPRQATAAQGCPAPPPPPGDQLASAQASAS